MWTGSKSVSQQGLCLFKQKTIVSRSVLFVWVSSAAGGRHRGQSSLSVTETLWRHGSIPPPAFCCLSLLPSLYLHPVPPPLSMAFIHSFVPLACLCAPHHRLSLFIPVIFSPCQYLSMVSTQMAISPSVHMSPISLFYLFFIFLFQAY